MKTKRIIAFITGTSLIIILFVLYSLFNGNPFVKVYGKIKIDDYLTTHFTELNYNKSSIYYNFKDTTYYMNIDVIDSEDMDFTISYGNGEIDNDYQWRVVEQSNTEMRLQIYLNEERWNYVSQKIFRDAYNFSLITPYQEAWKNDLPPLDMSIDDMLKKYQFEITIYLHDSNKFKKSDLKNLKSQVYDEYKREGIVLSKIVIERLNK